MTEETLAAALEAGAIEIPYFDGASVAVDNVNGLPLHQVLPVFSAFLELTADNRRADARHLVAYCQMMMEAVGEEEILEDLNGEAPTLENIWTFAQPSLLYFSHLTAGKYAERDTTYVMLEGNVNWEPEHGLLMSWQDGNKLVKVGAFDGHPTNGHAMADPEQDKYVFASDERHSTLAD